MKQFSREWIDAYYSSILTCAQRYTVMANKLQPHDRAEILDFLREFDSDVPLLKLDRWLGYVQRFMIEKGATTVMEERNWTRSLFRPLDFIPETRWERFKKKFWKRAKPTVMPLCLSTGDPLRASKYDCSICGCPGYEC